MAATLKISIIVSLIISPYYSSISHTTGITDDKLASFDIDAHLVQSKLETLKQERLNCFYRQGVNDKSFENCCGENYAKVENVFVNQYRILQQQLESSFTDRIAAACGHDHEPCEELAAEFSDCIRYDRDLYDNLQAKKKEIEETNKIDKLSLDTAFNRFEKNYKALMNARILISNAMINTVTDIQNFIKDSKLELGRNYMEFTPHFVYNHADENGLSMDEEHYEALKLGNHDFNTSFLAEAEAKKMINYYIANGYVRSEELDNTKMPSDQLKTVKKILEAKNQKLKF